VWFTGIVAAVLDEVMGNVLMKASEVCALHPLFAQSSSVGEGFSPACRNKDMNDGILQKYKLYTTKRMV